MSDYTLTPNYQFYKPTVDADNDAWGGHLNANADRADSLISSLTQGNLVYIATGGNTPRAAQDRAAEVINVKDYGAIGNGVADDTAALQAAATAAAGKQLYLPPGVYMQTASIQLPSNIAVCGAGRGVTVLRVLANYVNGLMNAAVPATGITVQDMTIDGNLHGQNGINFLQVSNIVLRNLECANYNRGLYIDGNGVTTTRGTLISNIYTHNNSVCAIQISHAQRQAIINGFYSFGDGGTIAPNAAIYLDASEMICDNIYADSSLAGSSGIYIHNIFGCTYNNLVATRCSQHGILVEAMTASTGANWRAQNNGMQTSGTYDDVHFDNVATGSYGITANAMIQGITVGPNTNYLAGNTTRYGLYIEDNVTTNIHLADVHYLGAPLTGNKRLPAVMGTLWVDDAPPGGPFLLLTGGTLTGGLTISNGNQLTAQNTLHQFGAIANASLGINLVGASGGSRQFVWYSNTNAQSGRRWSLAAEGTAESGANVGTNFTLSAWDDNGNSIGTALTVTRATMAATFAGPVRMNGTAGFNNTAPIAKPTVSGAKGSNAALASLMTALAAYGLVTDSTTA